MSSNAWKTASTRRGRGKAAKEMRTGRIAAAPGPAIAAGTRHAYLQGETTTACGVDLSPLITWPHESFLRGTQPAVRCRQCVAVVRGG